LDAISITREDRCSDRLEDESTGSHEDNTSPFFDRTIGGKQVERRAGRGRKEKNKLDSSRGSVPTET
jgi:hypothetical protein